LSRATFSECGEDIILEQVMNMCGLTKFQFIDVGSNHPKRSNDFYRSYLNRNHGISIDPFPKLSQLYFSKRKRDVFINAACVDSKNYKYTLIPNSESRLSQIRVSESESDFGVDVITPEELSKLVNPNLPLVIKIDIEGGDINLANKFLSLGFSNLAVLILETFEGINGVSEDIEKFERNNCEQFFKCAMTPHNNFYVNKRIWPF
jgi:FkbM family methyltransferase